MHQKARSQPQYKHERTKRTKAHSDTLFFDKNRRSGVTYVATGIGDLPRDLIVEVNVDAEGAVEMRPIPLAEGGAVKAMSAYGNEAWK